MYNIGGSFRKEDSETDDSGTGETTVKAKSHDYNLKLTLFRAQNIRSQYIRKEWNCPHGQFSLNRASWTRQTTDRYGILAVPV